jgi:hypothetical protein
VNIENEAPKDSMSTGSASPSSSHSLEVSEVQTTSTSSMIKSKTTSTQPRIKVKPETQSHCNRSPSLLLQQSMHNSNDSPHDDLEQNIPVTLIDHDTGAKQ